MNTYADAISAAEHERIYRGYWRGYWRSITEAAKQTGHAAKTVKDLVERVPVSLLTEPENLTSEDRVRWCWQCKRCLVCGDATQRKNARCCRDCAAEWRYCPDCKDVQPLSLFYSDKEAYCKAHRNARLYHHPAFHRRSREQQAAEFAEIQAMRRRGWTWSQIAAHYGVERVKTIQQRYTGWKHTFEEETV